jgi:hypothetical protein
MEKDQILNNSQNLPSAGENSFAAEVEKTLL